MPEEKITPAWSKQYKKEQQYNGDFSYAEGNNEKYNFTKGKSGKPLKGGLGNPKNWRGGKWEMTHDPYDNRNKLEANDAKKKISSQVNGTRNISKKTAKKSTKKIATKK